MSPITGLRAARVVPSLCVLLGALLAAGCATRGGDAGAPLAPEGAPTSIAPFAVTGRLDLSNQWVRWTLHASKRPTRYRVVELDGERVLEAVAERSASGLLHSLDVDPRARPILEWRWRTDGHVEGADVGVRHAEDAPLRIVLAFDGDKSSLPVNEQMFFERVKLFTGNDMPYATLMYVWGNGRPIGEIVRNPHTSRVRKIVLGNRQSALRTWKRHRRDIVADFEAAYGKKPGRLIAIGILSDTDNTRRQVRAYYGDLRLSER